MWCNWVFISTSCPLPFPHSPVSLMVFMVEFRLQAWMMSLESFRLPQVESHLLFTYCSLIAHLLLTYCCDCCITVTASFSGHPFTFSLTYVRCVSGQVQPQCSPEQKVPRFSHPPYILKIYYADCYGIFLGILSLYCIVLYVVMWPSCLS